MKPPGLRLTPLRVWLLLVLATAITYGVGEAHAGRSLDVPSRTLIFLLAAVKGALVVDVFMGLAAGPRLWRRLMIGWLVLVCSVIAGIAAFGP